MHFITETVFRVKFLPVLLLFPDFRGKEFQISEFLLALTKSWQWEGRSVSAVESPLSLGFSEALMMYEFMDLWFPPSILRVQEGDPGPFCLQNLENCLGWTRPSRPFPQYCQATKPCPQVPPPQCF